jgi:hypothetical protein
MCERGDMTGSARLHRREGSKGRLPTFLLIGAMKAGTTTLYGHLADHPQVFMPANKEPDFFVAEKAWGRGLRWYSELFAGGLEATAAGEASTSYTKCTEFSGVPERIAQVVPDVRLVYLLRDPVARLRSMYLHNVIRGRERRPIAEAVIEDSMYIGASSYAMQIRAYLPYFPMDRLLVVSTEELEADAVGVLERVYRFIGVDPSLGRPDPQRREYSTSQRRADSRLRTALRGAPGWEWAARALPDPVVRRLKTVGTRTVDPALARLPGDVEATLRERLAPDVADLRAMTGIDTTRWGW